MKSLVLDRSRCVGCRLCEIVCSMRDGDGVNPKRARIRVPASFPIPSPPSFCRQCPRPKCAEACPTGALDSKDINVLDQTRCDLCGACIEACPFGAIWKSPQLDVVLKCDLCQGKPLCVGHCPTEALSWPEQEHDINSREGEVSVGEASCD